MNKYMKYLVVAVAMAISVFGTANAQPGERGGPDKERMHERVEAQKIAYLTDELSLSPQEAQQFWPIYNEFKEKERTIRKSFPFKRGEMKDIGDADAEKAFEAHMKNEEALFNLRKDYTGRFKKVLNAKKVLRLMRAEEAFKRKLLKRLGDRREERREGRMERQKKQ